MDKNTTCTDRSSPSDFSPSALNPPMPGISPWRCKHSTAMKYIVMRFFWWDFHLYVGDNGGRNGLVVVFCRPIKTKDTCALSYKSENIVVLANG